MSSWLTKNGYKPHSAPVAYSQEVEQDQAHQAVPLHATYRQNKAGEQVGMRLKIFRFSRQLFDTLQSICRQVACYHQYQRRQRRKHIRRLLRSRFDSFPQNPSNQLPTSPPVLLAPGFEEETE